MSVVLREVFGWLLVVAGLAFFGEAAALVLSKRMFSAGPFVVMGFVLFRGGLHLVKVATAARAVSATARPPAERKVLRMSLPKGPAMGRVQPSVIPGTSESN